PPRQSRNWGRLKRVSRPARAWRRGDAGGCRLAQADGQPAPPLPADPALRVTPGMLEGSNVSPVKAMVGMIENARRFEMQMQVISEADKNAERANGLLSVG